MSIFFIFIMAAIAPWAFFGSQGLYAYDMSGKLKWKHDLGKLDVGAYDAPDYEWGTASSPIVSRSIRVAPETLGDVLCEPASVMV